MGMAMGRVTLHEVLTGKQAVGGLAGWLVQPLLCVHPEKVGVKLLEFSQLTTFPSQIEHFSKIGVQLSPSNLPNVVVCYQLTEVLMGANWAALPYPLLAVVMLR